MGAVFAGVGDEDDVADRAAGPGRTSRSRRGTTARSPNPPKRDPFDSPGNGPRSSFRSRRRSFAHHCSDGPDTGVPSPPAPCWCSDRVPMRNPAAGLKLLKLVNAMSPAAADCLRSVGDRARWATIAGSSPRLAHGERRGYRAACPPAPGFPYLVLRARPRRCLLGVQTLNRQWSTDYWVHQATVETFRHDSRDPPEELTRADVPSPSYTPYTFGLAAVARGTGLASVTVLQLAALANLVLFLVAFELFVTALTGRRLVAFWALLATLVMLGHRSVAVERIPQPQLDRLRVAISRRCSRPGWRCVVGLGPAALRRNRAASWWLAIVGPGMAVGRADASVHRRVGDASCWLALVVHRRLYRRDAGRSAAVAAAVGGRASCSCGRTTPFVDLQNAADSYTQQQPVRTRPAATRRRRCPGSTSSCAASCGTRPTRSRSCSSAGSAIYAYGAVIDDTNFGRVLPLILFAAHVGIGILVADWIEHRSRPSAPWSSRGSGCRSRSASSGSSPGLLRTVPRALLPARCATGRRCSRSHSRTTDLTVRSRRGSIVVARDGAAAHRRAGLRTRRRRAGTTRRRSSTDLRARHDADARLLRARQRPSRPARAIAEEYGVEAVLCARRVPRDVRRRRCRGTGPGWTLIRCRKRVAIRLRHRRRRTARGCGAC